MKSFGMFFLLLAICSLMIVASFRYLAKNGQPWTCEPPAKLPN